MASWDFTIDSDKQNELAGKLSEAADNFDTKVSLLYGQIDSMNGTSWIGEDYDTFHTGVHNYEGALKDLSNGFRMFSEHYKLMAEGTNTLASDLINIIKNMTGTNGVDYSSSGGSASYGSGAGRSDVVGNDGNASSTHQSSSGATHGGGGRRFDDADDTSSSSSINNSSTPSKTITRGDMVPIGDKEYEYYGTAAEEFSPGVPNPNAGRNIYKDGNRYIFVDENGNIEPVQGYDGSEDNNLVDVTDDNIDHMKTLYYCSDIKNASESTTLGKMTQRGEIVPIGDKEYEYYGTVAEEFSPGVPNPNAGRNIYKDGNRYIFVDENGNIEPVQGYDGSEDNNLVDVTDDNIDHMKTLYYCSDIKNASESTVL